MSAFVHALERLLGTPPPLYPATALTAIILFVLFVVVYESQFSPLSSFPGPVLARFSNLYAAYHCLIGDIHIDVQQCHQKYGKFLRYGPNRLLVNSAVGLNDIYNHRRNVQKSKAYLAMVQDNEAWSTFTAVDKAEHRFKRGLLSAGLKEDNLQAFQSRMVDYIERFCDELGGNHYMDSHSEPKNMIHWCEYLTLDIIAEFAFGQNFDTLRGVENRLVLDKWHSYNRVMSVYLPMPWLSKLRLEKLLAWPLSWSTSQKKWSSWVQQFTSAVLVRNSEKSRGIFSTFLTAKNSGGQSLNQAELWAEGTFLMLAGSETTATTLAASFFYLAHSEEVYSKVTSEVRNTFSHSSEIQTGHKLQSCKYLMACITEAMRISPAVSGILYREVLAGGILIDGEKVPQGTEVGTCGYALQRNPLYFDDPESYIPERWLHSDDQNQDDKTVPDKTPNQRDPAYSPFSIGPRSCPGRGIALMEISLTLAKVLWNLDFVPAEEVGTDSHLSERGRNSAKDRNRQIGEYQLRTYVTAVSDGPMLKFKKRDAPAP